LADFDKLVSQLKAGNVVGDVIRAGDTAVIPFAAIKFGLGAGGAATAYGGGMGVTTVPLGVLIVEGDDVRLERFSGQEQTTTAVQEILKAILERKIVFMTNGLNIGQTSGTIQDLAPMISEMMGQTTVMVNGLNLGQLKAPAAAPSSAGSMSELKSLFDARKYADALRSVNALIDKDPKSADAHVWKGRILGALAQENPGDMVKYGAGAMEAFEKALTLDPENPDAHFGRGMLRMMAPPGFGRNVDGAIADFEAATARKPSAEAYYQLGEALERTAQHDKAVEAYKRALELKPDYPEAAKALSAMD
jgi:uncharacterized spore protein YtfJ/Tfp pilus assembly protein PilF